MRIGRFCFGIRVNDRRFRLFYCPLVKCNKEKFFVFYVWIGWHLYACLFKRARPEPPKEQEKASLESYGTKWRFWTAKPTDDQREVVKWDEN